MTVQTLKIGKKQFVLVAKRDFDELARQARQRSAEDAYWTRVALQAEAESRTRREKPIPFAEIDREIEALRRRRSQRRRNGSAPGRMRERR